MTISALYRSLDDRKHDTATVLWRNDHRARIFAEFGILSLGPGSRHYVTEVMFTLKRSILNNKKPMCMHLQSHSGTLSMKTEDHLLVHLQGVFSTVSIF